MKCVRLVPLLSGVMVVAALGCNKSNSSPSSDPAPGPVVGSPGGTPPASSPQALLAQRCARCHSGVTMGGTKGFKGKGPDLSKVGADPEHTVEWLAAHIRNPKQHSPDSTMPAFERQLSAEEIQSLAEYLAKLK
ncbi:MAG TPA: cytochrome c [Gemmataceae bacterium]|nr:cytochrome c [Gemmataceae bacterium]